MGAARLVLALIALAGCTTGPAPTPIIIYVTPAPSAAPPSLATPFVVEVTDPPATPVVTSPPRTRTPRPATPTPVAREDFEILESGFSVVDGYVSFAVVGRNPNTATHVANYVPIQATFYDGDTIVQTEQEQFSFVLPGQTTAASGFASMDGRPDRLEIRVGTVDWETIDFTPGRFVFENVQTKRDRFSGWTTTGTMRSEFQNRQESIEVIAVHRNSAGDVVGSDSTFVDFVDPDSEVGFEISTLVDIKDVASSDVYFQL